jgi:hypothetical protein
MTGPPVLHICIVNVSILLVVIFVVIFADFCRVNTGGMGVSVGVGVIVRVGVTVYVLVRVTVNVGDAHTSFSEMVE